MDRDFTTIHIETGTSITDVCPLLKDYKAIYLVYDQATDGFVQQLVSGPLTVKSTLAIEGGERVKSLATLEKICSWLLDNEAGRDALLLIVGGGATSDVSAFAACIYKRGIRFAIIPTTLLAQVDAAIGGKNAVNLGGMKNMLGAIRQPEFTFICPQVLETLPHEEFLSGAAELLKTLIISGEGYEQAVSALADPTPEKLNPLILQAARFKAEIVEQDASDNGPRRVLNLGHTFGHAIEAETGMSHGKAVAIGIVMAAQLSEKLGYAVNGLSRRLSEDFDSVGLPVSCPVLPVTLIRYIKQDKKAAGGGIKFILPVAIGKIIEKEIYDLRILSK